MNERVHSERAYIMSMHARVVIIIIIMRTGRQRRRIGRACARVYVGRSGRPEHCYCAAIVNGAAQCVCRSAGRCVPAKPPPCDPQTTFVLGRLRSRWCWCAVRRRRRRCHVTRYEISLAANAAQVASTARHRRFFHILSAGLYD